MVMTQEEYSDVIQFSVSTLGAGGKVMSVEKTSCT